MNQASIVGRLVVGVWAVLSLVAPANAERPNILYILADDMGYGDVQCLNPERGKIKTPHMDQLAADGMIFTDAHSGSSVCTPTRYGILTGRYSWRTSKQVGVLQGYSEPLIPTDRTTVANVLKAHGYTTACIGKWHLGMTLPTVNNERLSQKGLSNVDWKGTVEGGPSDLGFDYHWGISASLDMPPYIYIENKKFVGECTELKAFKRKGPAQADFEAVDVLPDIGKKTVEFIKKQQGDQPFFAYVALTSPHTPIVPSKEWIGKSGLGLYGDFQMQTDDVIGQMIAAVDAAGLKDNTLIIVTADNGCSKAANIKQLEKQGHYPSAQYRGSKADIWDGGHRVPFIVRWPASVKAGSVSNETICLTDLMATAAELAGTPMPEDAGEDSVSFAPALEGEPIVSSRNGVVHHSIKGNFAYRMGQWKLCLSHGSGGWTAPTEKEAINNGAPVAQLYDLDNDPGETTNLYESHPEVAERLLKQLQADVERGRSTEGVSLENDIDKIRIWKSSKKRLQRTN